MLEITDSAGRIRPKVLDDPYALYARLRSEDPVHFDPSLGGWMLTRHSDVQAAVREPSLSSERTQAYLSELPPVDRERFHSFMRARNDMLLFCDGEKHTRIRGAVMKALHTTPFEILESQIRRRAFDLLEEVEGNSRVDLMSAFAMPFPIAVLLDMLGIPERDATLLRGWATDFNLAIGGVIRADLVEAAQLAVEELSAYLETLLHLPASPSPVLAHLQAEHDRGAISKEEMRASCLLLITAGHETVSNAIGNGLLALLDHPSRLTELRDEPEKVPGAIDELLRYDAPVQLTAREAKTPLRLGGQEISAGERVILIWGAANRDPSVFSDPNSLIFQRERPNLHLSFGNGHHRCAGASIARREISIGLQAVLARFPSIELAAPPERKENFSFRGLQRLLVDVSTAPTTIPPLGRGASPRRQAADGQIESADR